MVCSTVVFRHKIDEHIIRGTYRTKYAFAAAVATVESYLLLVSHSQRTSTTGEINFIVTCVLILLAYRSVIHLPSYNSIPCVAEVRYLAAVHINIMCIWRSLCKHRCHVISRRTQHTHAHDTYRLLLSFHFSFSFFIFIFYTLLYFIYISAGNGKSPRDFSLSALLLLLLLLFLFI